MYVLTSSIYTAHNQHCVSLKIDLTSLCISFPKHLTYHFHTRQEFPFVPLHCHALSSDALALPCIALPLPTR